MARHGRVGVDAHHMTDDTTTDGGAAEPNFEEDLSQNEEHIIEALNELTEVKAYTVASDELREFKAAQYALRCLLPEEYDTVDSRRKLEGLFDE